MEQGQMIWQQRISQATGSTEIDRLSDVDTTPAVVNGVVFALAYNGNLTALDLRSGQIMWKRELGSVNDFIVDGNRIYLVDQNDRVMALTIDGGVTLWTQSDLLHRLLTSPVLYNGNPWSVTVKVICTGLTSKMVVSLPSKKLIVPVSRLNRLPLTANC